MESVIVFVLAVVAIAILVNVYIRDNKTIADLKNQLTNQSKGK